MKIYKDEEFKEMRQVLASITCDVCKEIIRPSDAIYMEAIAPLMRVSGYAGVEEYRGIEFDLCPTCFRTWGTAKKIYKSAY